MTTEGHNSEHLKEQIQQMAVDYAKCDEESQKLNDKRAEIRDRAAELGLDTKAWQNEINRAKQSLKKKDGYDESAKLIRDALGDMEMEDLFSHVLRKEKEKEEAREAAKKEKEKQKAAKAKAKEAEKAKNDEYKSADERAPKNGKVITGKDAASGEKFEDATAVH